MKTNVFTMFIPAIICACIAITAGAKETGKNTCLPMFPDGKGWTEIRWAVLGECEYDRIRYTIVGDTVVGGLHCKKAIGVQTVDDYEFQDTEIYLEKDNVIYFVYVDEHGKVGSTILMDFNLKKGEQITWGEKSRRFYVLDEDTVTVNGISRRRMIMGYPPDREITRWVEGIGESSETSSMLFPSEGYYGAATSDEFIIDGEVVFTYDDFFRDSSAGSVSPVTRTSTDGRVYNLKGQRITSPHRGEVVIRNGKKQIFK